MSNNPDRERLEEELRAFEEHQFTTYYGTNATPEEKEQFLKGRSRWVREVGEKLNYLFGPFSMDVEWPVVLDVYDRSVIEKIGPTALVKGSKRYPRIYTLGLNKTRRN